MVQLTSEEKKKFCEEVASRLPEIRRTLHLTQARFGELAGISRARIIRVENGSLPLTWGQLTSVMCVCTLNRRTKEYFFANKLLGARFLQYIQGRDGNIPPATNICVHEGVIRAYCRQKQAMPDQSRDVVMLTKAERQEYAARVLKALPDLRRVMRVSQATLSELAGLSRARLIQLEKQKVPLSWSQMTSILFVCATNFRAKEYIYANNILPPRFLQYMQQKEGNIPPDTNICVPREWIFTYEEMMEQYRANQALHPGE